MSEAIKRSRAPRFHASDLNKLGVTIVSSLELRCDQCREFWLPAISVEGRLFGRWWICPKGCQDGPAKQ